ncbi:hypothetical protein [Bradyrhizobium viridifuturi]|uniref:hypothetical protein n=1 Tax=Bradyrhizobium viridifuturi TaxID=1654716 RepID=UPI000FE140AE|nr:hypothetical protein [Bradyrhizobium viridifuturi]
MNREYAEKICLQVFDALDAIYEAERNIAGLGKQERIRFHASVQAVIADLEDKLLFPICEQYPDLLPPTEEQRPRILCSELTWSEVNLPSSDRRSTRRSHHVAFEAAVAEGRVVRDHCRRTLQGTWLGYQS